MAEVLDRVRMALLNVEAGDRTGGRRFGFLEGIVEALSCVDEVEEFERSASCLGGSKAGCDLEDQARRRRRSCARRSRVPDISVRPAPCIWPGIGRTESCGLTRTLAYPRVLLLWGLWHDISCHKPCHSRAT